MNNKQREYLMGISEVIANNPEYGFFVQRFAENVKKFLVELEPEDKEQFNYDGMGY